MKLSCIKKDSGIVLLETTMWLGILLVFMTLAFSLVEYIQHQRFAEEVLEQHVRTTNLRTYSLSKTFELVVNETEILNHLSSLLVTLNDAVNSTIGSEAERFIEVAHVEVPVDVVTGRVQSVALIKRKFMMGNSSFVPGQLLSDTDFLKVINEKSYAINEETGAFLYAIPLVGQLESSNQELLSAAGVLSQKNLYAPQTVFIAVRLFLKKVSKTPVDLLKKYLKIEPVYHSSKFINLRGTFDM